MSRGSLLGGCWPDRYRPVMAGSAPSVAGTSGPTESAPALAPPWAAPVALVALVVEALAAGLVWHATRLVPIDAWVMHWQERVHAHGDRVAEAVAGVLAVAALVMVVADAVVGGLAARRAALLLALTAAPATLAAELVLKDLVHRQWHGDPDLLFPSGLAAVATAVAVST